MNTLFCKVLGFIFSLCLLSSPVFALDLNFYTFNIRFYGSPATAVKFGFFNDADRDSKLRELLKTKFADAHVMAFQEIVDVERFYNKVVPREFKCHSYKHSNSGHQHVVLCVKAPYTLKVADGDSNYIYEPVAMNTLRPAVYGILTDKDGEPVSYVFALHLKADDTASEIRKRQTELLAERVSQLQWNIPVVMLGDFNTHNRDVDMIDNGLDDSGVEFHHIDNSYTYTFRTSKFASHLDHYYVTPEIRVVAEPYVFGPCNKDMGVPANRQELATYNALISDHCPVKIKLGF